MKTLLQIRFNLARFFFLFILSSPFLLDSEIFSNFLYYFIATLVCFFNSLPNGGYSNLFIAAASKSFSGKISLSVKNSYLLKFFDDKAKVLAVCLSKSY